MTYLYDPGCDCCDEECPGPHACGDCDPVEICWELIIPVLTLDGSGNDVCCAAVDGVWPINFCTGGVFDCHYFEFNADYCLRVGVPTSFTVEIKLGAIAANGVGELRLRLGSAFGTVIYDIGTFNCDTVNVFTIVSVGSLCHWPATLTLSPVDCP